MSNAQTQRRPFKLGMVVFLMTALALPTIQVASQDYGPQFEVEDCLCGQGSYVDDGHSASQGILICEYKKEEAGADLFQNWKSLWLYYHPTAEEAIASLQDFLTDDHLSRYIDGPQQDMFEVEYSLLERTNQSLYAYTVTHYPPDREFGGEYGTYTDRPDHYYLERRFVHQTYDILIFVNGELFSSLDEAMAEVAELEACATNLIDAVEEEETVQPPPDRGEKTIGHVRFAIGRAQVQRYPSEEWVQLEQGMRIMTGDVIRTLEDGRIEFELETGRTVRMENYSSVRIPVANPTPVPEPSWLEAIIGRIWIGIKGLRSGDRYNVRTPNTVMGVKGTEYEIIVDDAGTIVNVFEGVVEVSDLNQAKTVDVNAGETSTCPTGGLPSEPAPFDANTLDRWWETFPNATGPEPEAVPATKDDGDVEPLGAVPADEPLPPLDAETTDAEPPAPVLVETADEPGWDIIRIIIVAAVALCGAAVGLAVLAVVMVLVRRK